MKRNVGTPGKRLRMGVVLVESALVAPFLLIGLLLLLDCGLRVARSNNLSDCVRHAARHAAIHGATADDPLGPEPWSGTLGDDYPLAEMIRHRLLTMAPADVTLSVTWPDGDHQHSDRVQVHLSCPQPALLPFWTTASQITAQSTMPIVH